MEVKKAELAAAAAAAQHGSSSPPEAAPSDDTLADKVSVMERKASSLAEQLHCKVCRASQVTAVLLLLMVSDAGLCSDGNSLRLCTKPGVEPFWQPLSLPNLPTWLRF